MSSTDAPTKVRWKHMSKPVFSLRPFCFGSQSTHSPCKMICEMPFRTAGDMCPWMLRAAPLEQTRKTCRIATCSLVAKPFLHSHDAWLSKLMASWRKMLRSTLATGLIAEVQTRATLSQFIVQQRWVFYRPDSDPQTSKHVFLVSSYILPFVR